MTHTYLKRLSDGKILDIPLSDVEETLKRGGFERTDFVVNGTVPKPKPPEVKTFACPLCDYLGPTVEALAAHKPVCPKI